MRIKKIILLVLILIIPFILVGCDNNEQWEECYSVAIIYSNDNIGIIKTTTEEEIKNYNNELFKYYYKTIYVKLEQNIVYCKTICWNGEEVVNEYDRNKCVVVIDFKYIGVYGKRANSI